MEAKLESNPPMSAGGVGYVIIDDADGIVFYADFRDQNDATLTPFDRLSGCMWSRSPASATIFTTQEEASRALQARCYVNPKRLKIIETPKAVRDSRPPL